jgi:hypothetical protein
MTVTHRLRQAMNDHDVEAFAACFSESYRSEQPAHPSRSFTGNAQVRQNWSSVFAGVPDFSAEMVTFAAVEDVEISEWIWSGTHNNGDAFEMRGVIVLGVHDGLIAWGRLYMEPVEHEGADIDSMVQKTYRPSR